MNDSAIKDKDDWKPKDIWLALLFLGIGTLTLLLLYLAWGNGFPLLLCCLGVPISLVLLLLGCNGVLKVIRSR